MDKQAAIDRILETENLTDNLEDDAADWLINWGVEQVEALIAGIEDDETAGEKVDQLMAVMRQLNRLIPKRANATHEDVQAFVDKYGQAFGQALTHSEAEHTQVAGELADKAPIDAMQQLLQFVKPAAESAPASQPSLPPVAPDAQPPEEG